MTTPWSSTHPSTRISTTALVLVRRPPRVRARDVGHHWPMRLDHLSYAAGPEGLAACVQRLGAHLGAAFTDGGLHPRFGTRNFILPLSGGCYIEVVEALEHPAADTAPFAIAVRARSEAGGGWLGWVIAVDDIAPIEARLGRAAADGHRRRPDGFDLRWKQIGVKDSSVRPELPFFVRWETDPAHHPSAGGSPVTLRHLEIGGNASVVEQHLGLSPAHLLDGVDVEWIPAEDGGGVLAAEFDTATGSVRID